MLGGSARCERGLFASSLRVGRRAFVGEPHVVGFLTHAFELRLESSLGFRSYAADLLLHGACCGLLSGGSCFLRGGAP